MTDTEDQHGGREQYRACEHEITRTLGIEDGPDLDTEEERQEGVDAEDPPDRTLRVVSQLMCREIRLVYPDSVYHPAWVISKGGPPVKGGVDL